MPERSNYLTNLKTKLLPNESRLIELKYTGKQFGKMDESERWFGAQTLLLKIHSIKGWTIPASEMMDILIDQFQHKLEESYANVTVAEFEYAFRNDTDTKDWGKALNLSMIDEVMIPYLENRFDLSEQEEKLAKPVMMIEEKKESTEEEILEWINEWKRDDINFDLIPLVFFDYLIQFNLVDVTKEMKWVAIEKSTQQIKSILQVGIANGGGMDAREMAEFNNGEKDGFTGKLKERILNRAKKIIVAEYLKPIADVKE